MTNREVAERLVAQISGVDREDRVRLIEAALEAAQERGRQFSVVLTVERFREVEAATRVAHQGWWEKNMGRLPYKGIDNGTLALGILERLCKAV